MREATDHEQTDQWGDAPQLVQLRRTAQWLQSLPLYRFTRDDGRLEMQARTLVEAVVDTTVAICRECTSIDDHWSREQCPPPDAQLPRVRPHGLGDQLWVVTRDLEGVLRRCAPHRVDSVPPPGDQAVRDLESQALSLRRASDG